MAAVVLCAAVTLFACPGGCGPTDTRFDVVDYRGSGETHRYYQPFDACYYCYDAQRNLHVVACRDTASSSGLPTRQVVHLSTFWKAMPGRTLANKTMINATVSYLIISGPSGASFEGSGFLSFRENRARSRITGRLELASLAPQRRIGTADPLFERAELSGYFTARRDEAKVISTLNEMDRLFGPMPRYTPPPDNPDLR